MESFTLSQSVSGFQTVPDQAISLRGIIIRCRTNKSLYLGFFIVLVILRPYRLHLKKEKNSYPIFLMARLVGQPDPASGLTGFFFGQ
jgi:hypothetical protein